MFLSNIKSFFAINCLTVLIGLENCLVGGTSCWFKFQAVFYANLHVIGQILLKINPLEPELIAQCDVAGDQNLNVGHVRKAIQWTFSVPDVRHFGHHTA